MYIKKNFSIGDIFRFSGGHLIWLAIWSTSVAAFYEFFHWEFLHIPWLPLSVIGRHRLPLAVIGRCMSA